MRISLKPNSFAGWDLGPGRFNYVGLVKAKVPDEKQFLLLSVKGLPLLPPG